MKKKFKVECKTCGKEFEVLEEESKFPKKEKYFCSRSCANTRHHSNETKEKIRKSVKTYNKKHRKDKPLKEKLYYCGSLENNKNHPEISRRQSAKYFIKFIPFGLDFSKIYTEEFIYEYNKVKELLYNEYVINCLSPKDIWVKYNCSDYIKNSETLLHVFRDMNFPMRGWSKATVNAFLQGKCITGKDNTHYKQQWHTTWNNKEVYLHSSYELKYAEELDKNKINYDVEAFRIKYFDTVKNEYRCAVPDFYIPSENLIVEIKSSYTLNIQNMKDKKKAYIENGYNFKLICDFKETEI